jgi:hypothetical protein
MIAAVPPALPARRSDPWDHVEVVDSVLVEESVQSPVVVASGAYDRYGRPGRLPGHARCGHLVSVRA